MSLNLNSRMHSPRRVMTRRQMLRESALGFGAIALSALLTDTTYGARTGALPGRSLPPHHLPKARNVIFLYMDGGVSQVDSFDPKPRLKQEDGRPFGLKTEPTQFEDNGAALGNLWDFKHYGLSGLEVSDLFPHIGSCADKHAEKNPNRIVPIKPVTPEPSQPLIREKGTRGPARRDVRRACRLTPYFSQCSPNSDPAHEF